MYSREEFKDIVNKAITNLPMEQEPERLYAPIRHILSIGGKRLRPTLLLMACNMFKDQIDKAILPAVGVEIFHNFTLVHDDIMDQAPLRRNIPTVHTKWSENQAILSGDVMAFMANECICQAPPEVLSRLLHIYNKAAIAVCAGQQMDMDFEKARMVSQDEYLHMIEMKTAALIAASLRMGAVIGGADVPQAAMLYDYGKNLGLAFQIQDDLLDVYGDPKVFGKSIGGDIVINKKTLLLIKAMETAPAGLRQELQEQLNLTEFDREEKIRKVRYIYDQLEIKPLIEHIIEEYIRKAESFLQKIEIPEERKSELLSLTRDLIGRNR